MGEADAIGRWLSGSDNDSYMYVDAEPPSCPRCLLVSDLGWVNQNFTLKDQTFDFSCTYDGATIVSRRFVEFAEGVAGGRFLPLPSAPGFAALLVDQTFAFDTERRQTRFTDRCPECGRFQQVAGATPPFLIVGERVGQGFSRSDQVFGSAADARQRRAVAQRPVIIVDADLGRRLSAERFTGLVLGAIAR
jgi:hypothetical protein